MHVYWWLWLLGNGCMVEMVKRAFYCYLTVAIPCVARYDWCCEWGFVTQINYLFYTTCSAIPNVYSVVVQSSWSACSVGNSLSSICRNFLPIYQLFQTGFQHSSVNCTSIFSISPILAQDYALKIFSCRHMTTNNYPKVFGSETSSLLENPILE